MGGGSCDQVPCLGVGRVVTRSHVWGRGGVVTRSWGEGAL